VIGAKDLRCRTLKQQLDDVVNLCQTRKNLSRQIDVLYADQVPRRMRLGACTRGVTAPRVYAYTCVRLHLVAACARGVECSTPTRCPHPRRLYWTRAQ
jgi:hypothetical protein